MDVATSVHGVPIRLTDERWAHILKNHPEVEPYRSNVLTTISDPDVVLRSEENARCAVRAITDEWHLVVLYREVDDEDGFIITSWLTTRAERVLKKEVLWMRSSSRQ